MAVTALGLEAATAGFNLIGQLFSGAQYKKNQKELMRYQNDINVANWKMMNDYNSPSAQLKRYTDAGLNPNLIYGDGASGGNASSAASSVSVPQTYKMNYQEALNAALDARIKYEQAENLKVDNQNKLKDIEVKDSEIYKNRQQGYGFEQQNDFFDLTQNDKLVQLKQQIQLTNERINSEHLSNEIKSFEISIQDIRKTFLEETNRNISARTDLTLAQKEVAKKQLEVYSSQIYLNYANAALSYSYKDLNEINLDLQIDNYDIALEKAAQSVNNMLMRNQNLYTHGNEQPGSLVNYSSSYKGGFDFLGIIGADWGGSESSARYESHPYDTRYGALYKAKKRNK